jgi:hypothetical protein
MAALGHERQRMLLELLSAFHPEADVRSRARSVRKGPIGTAERPQPARRRDFAAACTTSIAIRTLLKASLRPARASDFRDEHILLALLTTKRQMWETADQVASSSSLACRLKQTVTHYDVEGLHRRPDEL